METLSERWARSYLERGFFPIPVRTGEKGPKMRGWQDLRVQDSEVAEYFTGKSNIGLILGVDGLADVDLDCPEALSIAAHFLPKTDFVFGRKSRPQSHHFYWLDESIPSKKYLGPLTAKGDSTLLELRCTKSDGEIGLQTIVPPSVHPTGERIRFSGYGDPAKVKVGTLTRAVDMTATAALLMRYWPDEKCGRNETFLAFSGTLAHAGFPVADAIHLVGGIYRGLFGAEADMEQAAREVEATFKKAMAGMATTGFKRLTEFIEPPIVKRALQWLGLEDGEAKRSDNSERKSQATDLGHVCANAGHFTRLPPHVPLDLLARRLLVVLVRHARYVHVGLRHPVCRCLLQERTHHQTAN